MYGNAYLGCFCDLVAGLFGGSLLEGQVVQRFLCGVCCFAHCKFFRFLFGCGFVAR